MSDLVSRLTAALSDRYRLERELGGGGMSRVWVATETALDRQVPATGQFPPSRQFDKLRKDPRVATMLDPLGTMP